VLLAGSIPHPKPVLDDLAVSLEYGGYQHICLHVDNVDRTRAELAARGVDLIGDPFEIEAISRRLAFFRDPWGLRRAWTGPTTSGKAQEGSGNAHKNSKTVGWFGLIRTPGGA
jgi:hypothetical protein